MSITISNKMEVIDMGDNMFAKLRTKIAELVSPEIGEFYKNLVSSYSSPCEERGRIFQKNEKRLKTLELESKAPSEVFDFLYAPTASGSLSPDYCRKLWSVIEPYNDSVTKYGKRNFTEAATFNDFKRIVKTCADKNLRMYWF